MSRNIFSVYGLIDWLERQDPATTYTLWWKESCLLGRYFAAHGVAPTKGWLRPWSYGGAHMTRLHPLVRVVCADSKTYGAALERARKLAARGQSVASIPASVS